MDNVVIGKHLSVCGTPWVRESTYATANFMKSKHRSFSDENLAKSRSINQAPGFECLVGENVKISH